MPAIHLVHLLLLTALALLLPLLARILAAKIPPLLVVPLLELLTLRILLPLHLVGFPLVFLVQPGIVGSVMRRACRGQAVVTEDRKSTRLNSSHLGISYAVFSLKKKKKIKINQPAA